MTHFVIERRSYIRMGKKYHTTVYYVRNIRGLLRRWATVGPTGNVKRYYPQGA
jgi:hypothetical protein